MKEAEKNADTVYVDMDTATTNKSVKARGSKSKAAKQAAGLDFAQCLNRSKWDKESIFAAPKSVRSDTTCLTSAALEKSQKRLTQVSCSYRRMKK